MENAGQVEKPATKQHMRTLYRLTRTLCNERPRQSTAVLDINGNQINGKHAIQSRWTEHFKKVLNGEETEDPVTDEDTDTIEEIAVHATTASEVKEETSKWKSTRN